MLTIRIANLGAANLWCLKKGFKSLIFRFDFRCGGLFKQQHLEICDRSTCRAPRWAKRRTDATLQSEFAEGSRIAWVMKFHGRLG